MKCPKGGWPIEPKAEVFPVPVEMFPKLWPFARPWLKRIPGFDLAECRYRLLLGQDMLWMAGFKMPPARWSTHWPPRVAPYIGVIITSVSEKPPLPHKSDVRVPLALRKQMHIRKRFKGKKAEDLRTLKVHLAAGAARFWIESAVERITRYGKQQKCRILFLMAQKRWRRFVIRFWSEDWDVIAYSRDRVEKKRAAKSEKYRRIRSAQHVGWYRILKPVEKRKNEGNYGPLFKFELRELD